MNNKNLIKKKQYRKERIDAVISGMKNQYGNVDPKLIDLIDELNNNGFFTNISDYDIDYMLEENNYSGRFRNKNITVGIDNIYSNQIRIGVDPTYCFNKIGDCSIIAYFPMSKREFNRFKKLLLKLITDIEPIKKNDWLNYAMVSWCGDYAVFGR